MMGLLQAFSALRITGLNLFRAKNTEPLPWDGGRVRPERFRTSFALVRHVAERVDLHASGHARNNDEHGR